MIALIIILAILLLIVLLPVGGRIVYGEDGAQADLLVGFLRFRLFPREPKPEKKPKREKKPKKKKEKKKPASEQAKPKGGKLPLLWQLVQLGVQALGTLRRKILVRELKLYLTYGGDDPAQTAIQYGNACAAAHALLPLFGQIFRIRKQDVRVIYDPQQPELVVYAQAAITIRVGQIIAFAVNYGWRALKIFLASKNEKAVSR
jgi:hypothetical protein